MHVSQDNYNAARASRYAADLAQAFMLGLDSNILTNPYQFDTQEDLWLEFERGRKEIACLPRS